MQKFNSCMFNQSYFYSVEKMIVFWLENLAMEPNSVAFVGIYFFL